MGAWSADSKTNVATMGVDDFRDNEQSVVLGGDDTLTIQPRRRRRHRPRCSSDGLPVLEGEVVDATVLRVAALDAFLRRPDRPRQGRRRALLGAPQGHDDEGLRPDHLRPRRQGLPRPRSSRPTAPTSPLPACPPTTGSAASSTACRRLPNGDEIKAAIDQGPRRRPAPGDGQLRQGHHQPARAERRHRRRLDAGDDPHLRPHVGPRRRGARHPGRHPRQLVRRRLPGRHRRLPRPRRLRPDHDGLGARTSA